MSEKWILIVDDKEGILAVLKNSLIKLRQEYQVVTTTNEGATLEQLRQRRFDLVVTGYKMEGLDGLRLLRQIRLEQPNAQIILMTGIRSLSMEAEAIRLKVYGQITEPIEIDAFCQFVNEALGNTGSEQSNLLVLSEDAYRKVNLLLHQLQSDVGARCIFLTDSEGSYIARTENVETLPLARIATLLGSSIATLSEAGNTIAGNDDVFNLAYREGKSHSLYALNIGSQFLLIILIERRPFSSRLGSVWYSARRAAAHLLEELNKVQNSSPNKLPGSDLEQANDRESGKLFGEDESAVRGKEEPTSPSPPEEAPSLSRRQQTRRFTFADAVRLGIISENPMHHGFPANSELEEKH